MEKIEAIRNHVLAFHISNDKYTWYMGFAISENDIGESKKKNLNFKFWNIDDCDDIKELKTPNFKKDNDCDKDSKIVYMYLKKD